MTDKELKKLSRLELLEILLEQSKENEQLRLDNELYRQENESLQKQSTTANVDPDVLSSFSQVAEKIDSSLYETRKATQSYIDRLAFLAEYAQKNVVIKSEAVQLAEKTQQQKKRQARLEVTDERIRPEVEEISVAETASVRPLAKSKPVKKVETSVPAVEEVKLQKNENPLVAAPAVQPAPLKQSFVPVGTYPVMSVPVYQPVPVYYPPVASAPAQSPATPVSKVDRREENGVTVRHLQKKSSAPSQEDAENKRLISALVDFYFKNTQMLELLPEELKKEIINRFKR